MHTDKKLSKEDTWGPADLRRYIREEESVGDYVRRRDDYDRKHRGGESSERRHRDPEKESRREKERLVERESTRERRDEEKKDRRKEGSQDRRADRERDRRDEREREKKREKERLVDVSKYGNDYGENKERRRDREEKHVRERDKERHRDKDKERVRDSDRYNEVDRNKRGEYGAKERKREEQDRVQRADRDRRRHEESWEGRRDQIEKHRREEKDRHREKEGRKNEYEDKRNNKEQRRGDRKHSEQEEDREYKEEHRKHKEERERRHRERGHRDEKQKHDNEFREHQGEEIRHHRADRDRADRDKHKERRYKEEEDPERKHRERRHKDEGDMERKHKERRHRGDEDHRDTRSSSDKSHVTKRNVVETEVANDEDVVNQEYEDDFEDYEEDFEEVNESANEDEDEKEPLHAQAGEAKEELSAQQRKEMEALQRAMDEENERVGTSQSGQSMKREKEERSKWSKDTEKIQNRGSQHGKFIDFVAAKQREVSKKVADKQKKRSTVLLRLIDLDFSMTFSLLDLPPVNEYDMYIRNFGNANTKQAYVQCNEDNADREIQTEEIEMSEKWTQHPSEHSGACGDPNFSQESRDKYRSEMNFDSQRLASFLCSASQVMVVLLEEDKAARKSLQKPSTQSDMQSFSNGSLQLNTKLPFLYGRQISMLHFSQVQKHTMMSVHMPTTKPSAMALDSCTIICIWNIWEPSRPQRILVYESEIQCCCFSPGKATMVFAGTSVGSVLLWDLREQASNHYRLAMGEEEWTFRQPTFSTDAVMAASGHFSSVSSIEVVPSTLTGGLRPDIPLLASEEESSGLSFQLASLDESGVLNFWVVVELPKGNEAGSPTDLGLRPGGKVKLLHSSSLLTAERGPQRDALKTGPLHTLLLKFLPTDSNNFFIGTNMGLVHHGTSHGLKAPPKFYRFQDVEVQPVDVTAIHFSPFRPHLFLVGCGNGSIRLHAVSHEQPVAQWKNSTAGEPVVSLQWAQTRMTVFCVLDAASNLHIWDLLKNDAQPVVTERINSDRVTAMAVFGDAGKQNTYSGVALAHESGKIEMQYFKRSLTVSCSAEEEKLLESMMTEAF